MPLKLNTCIIVDSSEIKKHTKTNNTYNHILLTSVFLVVIQLSIDFDHFKQNNEYLLYRNTGP